MNRQSGGIFMENIKVVFFGTPVFACAVLQTLLDEHYDVIAAVSQPDKPVGRKHILEKTPVKLLAEKYGIPVIQPVKLRAESSLVTDLEPDLIVTCAYGQIIPDDILACPKYGCVNIHPSLLPRYRGGAPVHRAVWAGDAQTGVCLMEMVHRMDAGRVWARTYVSIDPDDTTESLNVRLIDASVNLVREYLPAYIRGELKGEEQDESLVVIARNIAPEEEQVHFSAEDIQNLYNHVRALIDWPVSYGIVDGKRIKFYRAGMEKGETGSCPGTILGFRDHAMTVACKGGVLKVYELQPEGKKKMTADAFANGAGRSFIGKIFE